MSFDPTVLCSLQFPRPSGLVKTDVILVLPVAQNYIMADTTALLGTIGTWLAVFLAFVALIGLVGPWLLLQQIYSERNRALNLVRDVNQDFITKGFGFSQEFRLFRKVRVPNLESRFWDSSTVVIPHPKECWNIKVDDGVERIPGTSCRTGWSRFCRLLQAYHTQPAFPESSSQSTVCMPPVIVTETC